jgi:hypothetical protein
MRAEGTRRCDAFDHERARGLQHGFLWGRSQPASVANTTKRDALQVPAVAIASGSALLRRAITCILLTMYTRAQRKADRALVIEACPQYRDPAEMPVSAAFLRRATPLHYQQLDAALRRLNAHHRSRARLWRNAGVILFATSALLFWLVGHAPPAAENATAVIAMATLLVGIFAAISALWHGQQRNLTGGDLQAGVASRVSGSI